MSKRNVYQTPTRLNAQGARVFCKVYRDTEWHQFIVRLYVANTLQPEADAFDDDKASAFATADAMVRHAATMVQS